MRTSHPTSWTLNSDPIEKLPATVNFPSPHCEPRKDEKVNPGSAGPDPGWARNIASQHKVAIEFSESASHRAEQDTRKETRTINKTYFALAFYMRNSFIAGVWEGHFSYGKEYDKEIFDAVHFRLRLEEFSPGQFQGKCIELEGSTANPHLATVKGFVEGGFISFIKEYPVYYRSDGKGHSAPITDKPTPMISYQGNYDWENNVYSGYWEFDYVDGRGIVGTGSWEMRKVT